MKFDFEVNGNPDEGYNDSKVVYDLMLDNSNIPAIFRNEQKPLYYNNIDDKAIDFLSLCCNALAYEGYDCLKKDLFLYSNLSGNGKTTWGCRILLCMMYALSQKKDKKGRYCAEIDINKNYCYFFSVPKFLMLSKDFNNPGAKEEFQRMKDYGLNSFCVLFDEVGSKYYSEYDLNQLYPIIDYRISNRQNYRNIFTSNIFPEDLPNYCGERLSRRILEYSKRIPFRGNRPLEAINKF